MVKLESCDGQVYEVEFDVISVSTTVSHMLEDIDDKVRDTEVTPLKDITGRTLSKILDWCTHYKSNPDDSYWFKTYCDIDYATLFEIVLGANYLNIQPLLKLTCQSIADSMNGKTAQQIRDLYNIKNDFTPEEEERVRKENEWCKAIN